MRDVFALRLGDSDRVVAECTDGVVRLPGADGQEVATIVGTSRFFGGTSWQLTFVSCEDRRLRLMSLWLLANQAVKSSGGAS